MVDNRKKACPNVNCDTYKKKKYDVSVNYCPICGEKLIFVCKSSKCFKPIEDKGPKHNICEECIAKREDMKAEVENKVKKVGGAAVAAVGAVFSKEIMKVAKDGGKKVAEKVVKEVIKH